VATRGRSCSSQRVLAPRRPLGFCFVQEMGFDEQPPSRGGPKWDLSPASKPRSTRCVSRRRRGPTRARSTTPTRAQKKNAPPCVGRSSLAVPVGFEFSSYTPSLLGLCEKCL
jgi:hypothetical protein